MSNKENIGKRCNCQCQEALINLKEDNRQFELRYNEIRGEGERLYQQYEVKSSKLREALEINHHLTDENQKLHDQNQSLAERLVQVLQEKSNIESEKQQELGRLLKSITLERQETAERFANLERKNTQLSEELSKAKEKPPLNLEIKVMLPTIPSASAARTAELNIVDPESIESMSNDELREHIDRVCISNELLRDEVRSLENKIRAAEQRCSAQAFSIAERDATIANLKAEVTQLPHLKRDFAEKQSEVLEVTEKYQRVSAELERSKDSVKELSDQIEQLLQQIERDRSEYSTSLKGIENEFKEKEKLASNLIQDLEGKMQEVEQQSSLFVHSQSQIAVLKEQDQRLRNQLAQLQLSYRNSQDDLKRMYIKHKKDLSDLEETYRHGEYVDRYEKLVQQLGRLEALCSTVSDWTQNLLTTIKLNEDACSALKRKKESLQKVLDRVLTRNAEWKHLKLQLASAKESEANVQKKCDQFMLRIASLEDEVSLLNLHNEELLNTIETFGRKQIESDCKSIISDLVGRITSQPTSDEKPRMLVDQEQGGKFPDQLNGDLRSLEQVETIVESLQAEILRLKQENDKLTCTVEQEQEVHKRRLQELAIISDNAQSQILQLQQENTQLKSLCHSESEKQHEIPFLQSRIKEFGVELEIRQKEYSDLLKSNQRLEDHNTDLLQDLGTLQDICKERDAEINLLRREISEKEIKLNSLEQLLVESDQAKQNLKLQDKIAQEELENLRSSNMDLATEIEDLRRISRKDKEFFSERITNLQNEREKVESRFHELKLKHNARLGQIEAMESQKIRQQQQLKTNEAMNLRLVRQIEEINAERDKLKQRLSDMITHKEQLLQEVDKMARQTVELDVGANLKRGSVDNEAMKEHYESKILKLKQAMLDYKTRGDRKIAGIVQEHNMVTRRCEQLELCVAEIGRICPQNAIIQSLVEEVERSKQKLKSDDKY